MVTVVREIRGEKRGNPAGSCCNGELRDKKDLDGRMAMAWCRLGFQEG